LKKTLDKPVSLWYNKVRKRKGSNKKWKPSKTSSSKPRKSKAIESPHRTPTAKKNKKKFQKTIDKPGNL